MRLSVGWPDESDITAMPERPVYVSNRLPATGANWLTKTSWFPFSMYVDATCHGSFSFDSGISASGEANLPR